MSFNIRQCTPSCVQRHHQGALISCLSIRWSSQCPNLRMKWHWQTSNQRVIVKYITRTLNNLCASLQKWTELTFFIYDTVHRGFWLALLFAFIFATLTWQGEDNTHKLLLRWNLWSSVTTVNDIDFYFMNRCRRWMRVCMFRKTKLFTKLEFYYKIWVGWIRKHIWRKDDTQQIMSVTRCGDHRWGRMKVTTRTLFCFF